jgi:replicative superfamily II helicase
MLDVVEAQQLLDDLEKVKIIEKNNDKYKITNLGRVAAHLYFDPFTIAGWYFNFNKVFYDKKEDDTSLSWALANVNKYKDGFVGKDQQDVVQKYKVRLMLRGMMTGDVQCIKGICFESLLENSDLANQKSKTETQVDFDRVVSALERIDIQHAHWNKGDFWKKLQIRIQYQVSWEQTELCSLNHIGGARVRDLFIAGIQTLEQFKADHVRTAKVLGNTIYNKVVTENDLHMPLINEEKQTDWKKVSKVK